MQAVSPACMAAWLCSKGQSCSMCVLRGGVLSFVGFCESRKRLLHTGKVAKVNVQGFCTTKKHTVGCCYSCNCSLMHPFSTRGIIVVCAFHVACYCFPGFAYSCQQRRKCQAYGPEHCNMSFTVLQTTWALCQGSCACADCTLHHLMLLACSASSVCNSCSPAAMLRIRVSATHGISCDQWLQSICSCPFGWLLKLFCSGDVHFHVPKLRCGQLQIHLCCHHHQLCKDLQVTHSAAEMSELLRLQCNI